MSQKRFTITAADGEKYTYRTTAEWTKHDMAAHILENKTIVVEAGYGIKTILFTNQIVGVR